jgi:hypothetical protein
MLADDDPAAADPPAGDVILPTGWTHQLSRSAADTYYFNIVTSEATYDEPLGPGQSPTGSCLPLPSVIPSCRGHRSQQR